MDRESRRQFLTRSAVAGTLALRALRTLCGQAPERVPIPGLEVGEPTKSLALRNVTVIDGTGKPALFGRTVVIAGDRIQSLGETGRIAIAPGTQIIEAAGRFLIPGLWDMHGHSLGETISPLFVANGVTGTRIMRGTPAILRLRAEIAERRLLGPRLVVASPSLNGPGGDGSNADVSFRIVANSEQGRLAVRNAVQEGADFIKVLHDLSRDTYFAVADEAKKLRVPYVGHVPWQVTPEECSNAGQKSIEHTFPLELAYTAPYTAWRQAKTSAKDASKIPMIDLRMRVETFSLAKAAAFFPVFRRNHTWVCPTLTASLGLSGDPSLREDPRLKYIAAGRRAFWEEVFNDPNLPLLRRAHYEIYSRLTGAMHKAGIGILAGTDPYIAYCWPGFSLHDELRHLVTAGLSEMDALRAATYRPAEFLGLLDTLGTVERGKLAELVLLDANPLDDITNTQKINMVFTGGRVYRKPTLEAMLNAVEVNARG